MNRRRLIMLAVAALSVLAAPAVSAEPVTLKVNYSAIPPHLIPAIFMKKDLIKHEGKSYNVKFVFTRGSAIVMQALAANEMDLGVLSSIAFVHGIQNAKQPFRAIGDLVLDGPQFTSRFAVKKDSPIKTVEDLKGHSIAVNAFGGALDMAARLMLKKHGLVPGKDVTIVEAKFPAMHAMVTSGKVDAAVFIAPFWYPAEKAGDLRPLFTMKEVARRLRISVLGGDRADAQEESRRARRLLRGLYPRSALVPRPQEPHGSARIDVQGGETARLQV